MPAKNKFFSKFFCLLLFEATFTSVFKDKKSKISSKIIETEVFLTFLLVDGRIQIRILTNDDGSGFGRPRKHMDPDPQRWFLHRKLQAMVDMYVKGIVQPFKTGVMGGIIRLAFKFSSFLQFF
jgi:hypothetical protein